LKAQDCLKVTHILITVEAIPALPTRDAGRQDNSIANGNVVDVRTYLGNLAGNVRSEYMREWLNLRAITTRGNIEVIHRARLDFYQYF
jgi:hypothetical protein